MEGQRVEGAAQFDDQFVICGRLGWVGPEVKIERQDQLVSCPWGVQLGHDRTLSRIGLVVLAYPLHEVVDFCISDEGHLSIDDR